MVPFEPEEVDAILQVAAEDRLGAFYTVALAVGLRPSEALGLGWADIDFAGATWRVQRTLERQGGAWSFKEPKSRTSRRTIPLPRVCAEQLAAHRHRQLFERRGADEWEDNDLVLCTPTGRLWTGARYPAASPSSRRRPAWPTTGSTTAATRRRASS